MPKCFLLLVLVLINTLIANAQDSVLVTTKYAAYPNKGKIFEEYFVHREDSVKHGNYIQYSSYGKILVKGQYEKGNRTGVWEYYENSVHARLVVKFDWSNFSEVYYQSYSIEKPSGSIKIDGKYELKKLDKEPHFPGGWTIFYAYLKDELRKLNFGEFNRKIYVSFEVNEKGQVENVEVLSALTNIEKGKIIEVFKKIPDWTPAELDGKLYAAKYSVPILFEQNAP